MCTTSSLIRPLMMTLAILLCLSALPLTGCGVLGAAISAKQGKAQQAEYMAQQDALNKEGARLQKIQDARRAIMVETLDAQVYKQPCEDVRPSVEGVVTAMGHDVHYTSKPELVITNWKYVSADYSGSTGKLRKTRKASKSRYTAEVQSKDDTSCQVRASFQKSVEQGAAQNSRAYDFEVALMQKLNPEGYAEMERQWEAVDAPAVEASNAP